VRGKSESTTQKIAWKSLILLQARMLGGA